MALIDSLGLSYIIKVPIFLIYTQIASIRTTRIMNRLRMCGTTFKIYFYSDLRIYSLLARSNSINIRKKIRYNICIIIFVTIITFAL